MSRPAGKLAALAVAVALSACQSATAYRTRVVVPPDELYRCPLYRQWPDHSTLTDRQVARTVIQLYSNNVTCRRSLDAVRDFLKKSREVAEEG